MIKKEVKPIIKTATRKSGEEETKIKQAATKKKMPKKGKKFSKVAKKRK